MEAAHLAVDIDPWCSCIPSYFLSCLDERDKDKLFEMCDPDNECLCLFGYPDGSWEVRLPFEEVPPEIPEPLLGLNFARDGMENKEWRLMVAKHSDSWLLSAALYFGARFLFGKSERSRLFDLINELPTVYQIVNEESEPEKDQTGNHNGYSEKTPCMLEHHNAQNVAALPDDDHGRTFCSTCGEPFRRLCVRCHVCTRWFRLSVNTTAAKTQQGYKCRMCSYN